MNRPARQLPVDLGDAFLRSDAIAAGVSPRRLRNADLEAPFRGVRKKRVDPLRVSQPGPIGHVSAGHASAAHPLARRRIEHLERARLYSLIASDGAFFCGRTAAVILGLPVELKPAQDLEVGRLYPARAPRVRGIRGVQVRPGLVALQSSSGLRTTSPSTTWAMLGRWLSREELVVLGDAIVNASRFGRDALIALDAAASVPGRPRARLLREALSLVRVGSASPPETQLRLALHAAGLPEPELDVNVRDASGGFLGRSELAYPDSRLAIEYESDHHRVDQRQWNRDIDKYQAYAESGWRIIRVTAAMLYTNSGEMVRQVADALAAAER
ncbi:hypothetical protein [Leucobacter aridicollis]|uniref:hypothetical protein n=1 Tax=Leucobacter aridicollis TaxID=283878 RepID=UPI0021035D23|nr:hypothetical protein [Leucobacter aridicollis]UTX54066.1 hypothetical protein KI794_04935 [Leucobacter aridicollis]